MAASPVVTCWNMADGNRLDYSAFVSLVKVNVWWRVLFVGASANLLIWHTQPPRAGRVSAGSFAHGWLCSAPYSSPLCSHRSARSHLWSAAAAFALCHLSLLACLLKSHHGLFTISKLRQAAPLPSSAHHIMHQDVDGVIMSLPAMGTLTPRSQLPASFSSLPWRLRRSIERSSLRVIATASDPQASLRAMQSTTTVSSGSKPCELCWQRNQSLTRRCTHLVGKRLPRPILESRR
jgi:hypothetical protein